MCYGTGVWCLMKASGPSCLEAPKIVSGAACRNFTWALGDRHVCLSHLGLECRSHCHIQLSGPPNWRSSLQKIGNGYKGMRFSFSVASPYTDKTEATPGSKKRGRQTVAN